MKYKTNIIKPIIMTWVLGIAIIVCTACESFVEIDPPITELGTEAVFMDDNTALAAMNGVYINMMNNFGHFANKNTTLFAGLSADEFKNHSTDAFQIEFFENELTSSNSNVGGLWKDIYKTIYHVNAILEGVQRSEHLSKETKDQLKGESLCIRAFGHFYLMQFFGQVPYIKSTDFEENSKSTPESTDNLYTFITEDLITASDLLQEDYGFSSGERIHPNRFAALALLARVSLYMEDWASAESYASRVLEQTSLYALETDLNQVFKANSQEAIWQIQPVIQGLNTMEGYSFNCCVSSNISLSNALQNRFEANDKRWNDWVGSLPLGSETLFYPFKYKVLFAPTFEEYYMVFRLAELYLIRAEARAYQNDLSGGFEDLNSIRNRAQLASLPIGSQSSLLEAIAQERSIELFAEWGHRWFDLKRTGNTSVLEAKPSWEATDLLYPIPESELLLNAELVQNPGY